MDEFPPLVPTSTSLTVEERLLNMEEQLKTQKEESKIQKEEWKTQKEQLKSHAKLLLPFCERELLIIAGEILKWAVNRQGVEDGHGMHLFDAPIQDKVLLACRVFLEKAAPSKKDVTNFQLMSQQVIMLRNTTAHFKDLEALERMVKMVQHAIQEWPQLAVTFPNQVKIVNKYQIFKAKLRLLPGAVNFFNCIFDSFMPY